MSMLKSVSFFWKYFALDAFLFLNILCDAAVCLVAHGLMSNDMLSLLLLLLDISAKECAMCTHLHIQSLKQRIIMKRNSVYDRIQFDVFIN